MDVSLYFQVHQPYRARRFSWFHRPQTTQQELGRQAHQRYFDDTLNAEIFNKVARKCYLPANAALLEQVQNHHGNFRIAYSITGTFLDQCQQFPLGDDVLDGFQALAKTGSVEFLSETYYHALPSLGGDWDEFDAQVERHRAKIKELFGQTPRVFRNTEILYTNELAKHVERLGFAGVLAEGSEKILGWRSPSHLYRPTTAPDLKMLLRHYRLSDDIGYRFSERSWKEWPLTADRHAQWVTENHGELVNLFMDYETFGEHHWVESGIFEFLRHWPAEVLRRGNRFLTPTEMTRHHDAVGDVDVPYVLSWADLERDESAWLGNRIQKHAFNEYRRLGPTVKDTGDEGLIHAWRKLGTSDHFYYMCTKNWSDGDVHKYFSPFKDFSPYDNFINYMNVLTDLRQQIEQSLTPTPAPNALPTGGALP